MFALQLAHDVSSRMVSWPSKCGLLNQLNQQKVAGFPELVPKSSCTESPFKTSRSREGSTAAWQCGVRIIRTSWVVRVRVILEVMMITETTSIMMISLESTKIEKATKVNEAGRDCALLQQET